MKENNKIIAEFIGFTFEKWKGKDRLGEDNTDIKYCYDQEGNVIDNLLFDSDWNLLMEVVEKILNICSENDDLEKYHIITDNIPYIQPTYNECVKFIKFYNQLQIK